MASDYEMRAISTIDGIRLRPGMYVGGIDRRAIFQLIEAILQNVICHDPFGQVRGVAVTLLDDGFIKIHLEDDGLPIDIAPDSTTTRLEMLMTSARAIGMLAHVTLNALSSDLTVTTKHDGYEWQQSYQAGIKTTDLTQLRSLTDEETSSTTFLFKPDSTIFTATEVDIDVLSARLREIAYLTAGLPITFNVEQTDRDPEYSRFYFPRGLYDMLRDVMPAPVNFPATFYQPIHAKIVTNPTPIGKFSDRIGAWTHLKETSYEIALQFRPTPQVQFAYCDMRLGLNGGTHLDALRDGIVYAINQQAQENGILRLARKHILSHVAAVTHIMIPNPQFADSMARTLTSPEVREPILQLTTQAINDFASKYPDQMSNFLRDLDWRRHQDRDEKMERREKRSHGKSAN